MIMLSFSIGGGGLLDFLDGFFYCGEDFWKSKDLKRSVISFRELMRLSGCTGVSLGTWSLGGPQGILWSGEVWIWKGGLGNFPWWWLEGWLSDWGWG